MLGRERAKIDYAAIVQDFCLMDDEFMTVFFDGQIECAEYVLRIILDRDDLHVIKSESQYSQTNLYGRRTTFWARGLPSIRLTAT